MADIDLTRAPCRQADANENDVARRGAGGDQWVIIVARRRIARQRMRDVADCAGKEGPGSACQRPRLPDGVGGATFSFLRSIAAPPRPITDM